MNAFTNEKEYFELPNKNPWANTSLETYYSLNPASKGSVGENIVERLLISKGYKVEPRRNSGHDRIINGRKTEIKFGLATNRNLNYETIFNHIGYNKDWEDILFVCVNGDGDIKSALYSKDTFLWELTNRQQGGKTSENDDFMISGKASYNILFSEKGVSII